MINSLQKTKQPKEETLKKRLQQAILRKRQILGDWTAKVEMLEMDLELVKNEYNVRVGRLLLKDNQLDLEIIQYKNLKKLMDEGMTYAEAVRYEEDKFYNEILRMQKEQEAIEEEEAILNKRKDVSTDFAEEIKNLWKQLIRKFHPDLVTNVQEKEEREEIMKKINKAYTENDLETLKQFQTTVHVEQFQETTVEMLEQILVETENIIITLKEEYKDLRESQWYAWKIRLEKARKTEEDIFKEWERSLLDDIAKKITIRDSLKQSVEPK